MFTSHTLSDTSSWSLSSDFSENYIISATYLNFEIVFFALNFSCFKI